MSEQRSSADSVQPTSDIIRDAWSDLVEKDDRTSPEDCPDMALITEEELRDCMLRMVQPARTEPQTASGERLYTLKEAKTALEQAIQALSLPHAQSQADSSPQATPELTATCQKLLPGGIVDDATYAEIEDALDRAEAPSIVGGRWLKLHERIAALTAERTAASAEPQSQAVSAPQSPLLEAVEKIAKQALSTETDGVTGDYEYGYDECVRVARAALTRPLRPDEPAISSHQRSQGE